MKGDSVSVKQGSGGTLRVLVGYSLSSRETTSNEAASEIVIKVIIKRDRDKN